MGSTQTAGDDSLPPHTPLAPASSSSLLPCRRPLSLSFVSITTPDDLINVWNRAARSFSSIPALNVLGTVAWTVVLLVLACLTECGSRSLGLLRVVQWEWQKQHETRPGEQRSATWYYIRWLLLLLFPACLTGLLLSSSGCVEQEGERGSEVHLCALVIFN